MGDREKKIFLFFLIVFFGFCALFAAQKITSFDVWWHLKTGEWIWQHKAIPYADPFSYTFRGAKWIDFEWLFQVVIYPIYQLGGFDGLIIFKMVVIILTFMIIFLTCREVDGGRKWLTITVLFVALLVARGRFKVRPDIILLLFLALYNYLLTLHRDEKITTRQLIIFLLPIHVLWVNFHGSFLLGIFMGGAFALGRFVPLATSHHRDLKPVFKDGKLQGLLFLCLLLCIASLLNPQIFRVFLIPFKTAGSETLSGIAEWASLDIRFVGLFVINPTMWFRALFLFGVVSFVINRSNFTKVENVLIFALFSYMAFKHIRFSGAFAIVAVPIIVYNLSQFRWQIRGWQWARVLPLLIVIIFTMNGVIDLHKEERLGFGVWSRAIYPKDTMDFLKNHDVRGKIFNTYGYGGYIIWHLYPAIPVFIDGRTPTIYDQDFFWLYSLTERKKELWKQVSERYGIEIVLVHDDREKGYAVLFNWLDEDEDWRLMAFDDVSNLYMKKGEKFDNFIKQYGFRYLKPSDMSMDYAKAKKDDERFLEALEHELKVACQRFPQNFYPFYYLGIYHRIYETKEHFSEAEKAFLKAIANRPDLAQGYYELGLTYMQLERYDEATEALKKAIGLNPHILADAYYNLGLSLYQIGNIKEAIKFLEIYKKKATLGTRVDAYRLLGKAYLQRYKLQKALSCFKRVTYLEKPTWETFLNMGVVYLGLDRREEARESFERAMEMSPDKVKTVYNLAVVYDKLGLQEKANRLYMKASELKPETAEDAILLQKAREKAK